METVAEVADREIHKRYVEGPVGVQARNFSKARIQSLGWKARRASEKVLDAPIPGSNNR